MITWLLSGKHSLNVPSGVYTLLPEDIYFPLVYIFESLQWEI